MEKKLLKHFFAAFLIGVFVIGIFVYAIDPFYHYHKPWFGMDVYLNNAVYQTPGAAENLEYDSVLMGTSMTENFDGAWFDEELGWNTVKLSYSGARSNDLAAIFDKIYSGNNEVKNIFLDINGYQLTVEAFTAFTERPEYLYDENVWNDINYIYNKDVIAASAEVVFNEICGVPGNLGKAYSWGDTAVFGKEIALDEMREERENPVIREEYAGEAPVIMNNCKENLENIGKTISSHPETTFYIFYPPYSILYWEELIYSGKLDGMYKVYLTSMEYFLKYPNVKLYSFQNEPEIITDLDNYLDACHHTTEINRYIFECIRDGKNEITPENYKEQLDGIFEFVQNIDYDFIWNGSN